MQQETVRHLGQIREKFSLICPFFISFAALGVKHEKDFYMPVEEQQATTEQVATSAGTQNTDKTTTEATEAMIPKSRFDEINKKAKDAEKRLAELEKAKTEAETAKLTEQAQFQKLYETEKAQAARLATELEQMKTTLKRTAINQAVEREAATAKFADPADAHAFLDVSAIELDEQGKPQGIQKMIADLAKSKPYLLAQTAPAQGNGQKPKPQAPSGAAEQARGEQAALQKIASIF